MSAFELSPGGRAAPPSAVRGFSGWRGVGAPASLAVALLALLLYGAFAQGAVRQPAEARLQVGTAAIAALAAASWLWAGRLRLRAPRLAWVGVALLGAFAIWSGVSVVWSVAANQSWIELNRYLEYVLVLCLGISVGASAARSLELIASGFVLVVLAATLYAIGQKVAPGVHVPGLFDLNQTAAYSRLQQPFGYWNALALFVVMGVPCALALAGDERLSAGVRLGALGSLELMFVVIAFTYSRGGLVALAVALVALVALSGRGLRTLLWLAAAGLASIPPLLYGLSSHALSASGVPLASREHGGAVLAIVLVLSLGALVLGGLRGIALERRTVITPERRRAIVRMLVALGGLGVLAALLAIAFSSRGFTGTFLHAWRSFTSPRAVGQSGPNRLLSVDSEYRWGWWKEAASAFAARPVVGWGAGSFPVVHLLYRMNGLQVMQPHSVPLQWLAETGIVGALLGIGAFVCLLVAGTGAVRRRAPGGRRLLAAAMVAAGFAYAIHACYDWDSDIPGLTLPVLLLLGTVAGSATPRRARRRRFSVDLSGRRPGEPPTARAAAGGWRAAGLAAATLSICAFALSAALPSLAQTDATSALAGTLVGGGLAHADALAAAASRLDPLSDAGSRSQATLSIRAGELSRARDDLLVAVRRDPSDRTAWTSLASVELYLREPSAALHAANRALALDPNGWRDPQDQSFQIAADEAVAAMLLEAPPASSATRVGTPGYARR